MTFDEFESGLELGEDAFALADPDGKSPGQTGVRVGVRQRAPTRDVGGCAAYIPQRFSRVLRPF